MPKRTYNQFCDIANALDAVGERWTLLLVREMVLGPKRYSDLLGALPGIGTNLLADRLKEMEGWGIIQRRSTPPPVVVSLYELTERGRELEPVIDALYRWGAGITRPVTARDSHQPAWSILRMRYSEPSASMSGITETYEFRIGNEVFHARLAGGRIETGMGPDQTRGPDLVFTADTYSFFAIVSGRLNFADAVRYGAVEVKGGDDALARSLQLLGVETVASV